VKLVPTNIGELLTPVAIAFWCASDATYHKRDGVVILCTDSFTADEVDKLRSILLSKFNIHATRYAVRPGQYRIRIAKSSMPSFQELVDPHIPPTMRYRVGL
jgi:hypothetical protein